MCVSENNYIMKLLLDKIVLYLTISILSLSWLWYLGVDIRLGFCISCILSLLVCMIVYRTTSKIPIGRYLEYLRTLTDRELYEHIAEGINPIYLPKATDTHVQLANSSILVAQVNYGGISKDYISNLAKKYRDCERIYLFTPHDTKGLLAYSKIPIIVVHPKTLVKKLSKLGYTLPSSTKKHLDLSTVFHRSRAKYYLLSGVVLMLNIFFYTPYRLYYIISSSILLTMSLFCLFNKSPQKTTKIFE